MIGDTVLGEIVGAVLFAALTGADLVFAVGGIFRIFLGDLPVKQAGAQDIERLDLVFLLRTLVGATNDHAGGLVDDLHGGIRRVHALPAFAGRAADVDLDLVRLDFDVHLLRFGHDGNSRGAGMDAPLRLGRRHALDAMHAALVFQTLEYV